VVVRDLTAVMSRLRALQPALDLIAFRDAFGDTDQWDARIRGFVAALGQPARP
jgi:hypothetical protein